MRIPGTIRNIDYYNTEENNPISDYACLKHFFQCKEVGADTETISWTDSKGGLTVPIVLGTAGADGTKIDSGVNSSKAITGTFSTFAVTDRILSISLLKSSGVANGITFGSTSTAPRIFRHAPANTSIVQDASGTSTSAVTTGLANVVNMIGNTFLVGGTNHTSFQLLDSGVYTAMTATTSSTVAGIPTPAVVSVATQVDALYGTAIFKFANGYIPGDLRQALVWMKERWLTGDKVIWPGWRHLP